MKSINIEKREYYIYNDKYILNSLKDIIENKGYKKVYIISKVSGHQLNTRKDKPYNLNEVNIICEDEEDIFIYDMVDNAPKEIDIEHVYSITYVPTMNEFGAIYDSIVFLRIGVFLDLFEYLCNRPRIAGGGLGNKLRIFTPNTKKFNLDKMKKRIQNYYDKSIFPAYRIYSKLSEEYELFYSQKHLLIYDEIYQLEKLKLDVKQIEDLVNNKDFKSKKKTIIRGKILEKRIRLIEQLADSYEDEELEEILFSILYSLNKDNTIIKIGDIIELIILYSRKNKISVDDDKTFYYLIFKIKHLIFDNIPRIVSYDEGDKIEDYNIILKLYLDKYKEMKDRNKESLDKEYNSEDCIRYGYDNLNHDDYLINEEKLSEINVLNRAGYFYNLFLKSDSYEYKYRQSDEYIYSLSNNKYHEYMDLLFYLLDLRIDYNIKIIHGDEEVNNDIISILEDINAVQKIAERFYFLGCFNDTNKYKKTMMSKINSIKIKFAFKYIEEIKAHINNENRKYVEYDEAFNYIIDFIEFTKIRQSKKEYYNEKHYLDYDYYYSDEYKNFKKIDEEIFEADDNDLKIIEKVRKSFLERGMEAWNYFSETGYKDIKENYKEDRRIFFENNYKIIYKKAKEDGIKKMNYIKSIPTNNVIENEDDFIDVYFLNYMNYIYQKKYYIDYFKVNKIDLKKLYIERTDIFEEHDENNPFGFRISSVDLGGTYSYIDIED